MSDAIEQPLLTDPTQTLIRRRRWKGKRRNTFVPDQKTGRWRPTAAAFEPSPTNTYLSVNIEASMAEAGLLPTWGVEHESFYAVRVAVGACLDCGLRVASVPVEGNPHHGGVYGLVELRVTDEDGYQRALDALAEASEILPESLSVFEAAL